MDLREAQRAFQQICDQMKGDNLRDFLCWVSEKIQESDECHSNADVMIDSIREDLRATLPLNAVLPSENVQFPTVGQHKDCNPLTTVNMDAFLYDDDVIDDLCEAGKFSRNYCTQCGSHSTAPVTFISHSVSKTQLKYLFQFALPDLQGKTVLDIGSRLGAVLYGAYYYSNACRIIGVEMNADLCRLQCHVVDKYCLADKIQVICADILTKPDVIKACDIIILNLVEFFVPPEIHKRMWELLASCARKRGSIIATIPSVEETVAPLQCNIDIGTWLQPVDITEKRTLANKLLFGGENCDVSDLDNIHIYQVV